jgi:hypothetical protein
VPIRSPEQKIVDEFNARNLTDREWSESRFTEVVEREVVEPPEPLPQSPEPSVSDEEYAAKIAEMLHQQVIEGWELILDEATAALKINPDDETARYQLLGYEQWKRQQAKPEAKRNGLVIGKPKKKTELITQERVGVWKRDVTGRWVIRVARSEVGDSIRIKKADGKFARVRLLERVAPNEYLA